MAQEDDGDRLHGARARLDLRAQFAWMALRRHDLTLGAGALLRHEPKMAAWLRPRLPDPPGDLQMAVYSIAGERGGVVEALHYTSTDGHPHLDIYWTTRGGVLDAETLVLLKRVFFGHRAGVSLATSHGGEAAPERWARAELLYCPNFDPESPCYRGHRGAGFDH